MAKAKKAQGVTAFDMRRICSFCDYFVILSATSLRQVNAIAQAIEEDLAKHRIKSLSKVASNDESGWIVLDYSSVRSEERRVGKECRSRWSPYH